MLTLINLTYATTPTYLDWHQRPQVMKERIDNVFNSLPEFSDWGSNGCSTDSFSIDSDKLIQKLAQERQLGEIVVLDIGAGDGRWSRTRAQKIADNSEFPSDVTVHFYNLIGERGVKCGDMEITPNDREEIGSNCIIHNVTRCKIEELSDALSAFNLESKVDYINSSWTFRHLVDPAGTLLQAYDLLRKDGILSADGFLILYSNQSPDVDCRKNMLSLLKYMNVPFLMEKYTTSRAVCHFIIKKWDDFRCNLPLTYSAIHKFEKDIVGAQHSRTITVFRNGNADNVADWTENTIIYGSLLLLKELRSKNVFLDAGIYGRVMQIAQLPDDRKEYICIENESYSEFM